MNSIIPCTLLLVSYNFFAKAVEDAEENHNVRTFYNIDDAENLFKKFIKDFNKVYKDDTEYNYRLKIFIENLEYINRVRLESNINLMIINECADTEEFNTAVTYLGESVAFIIITHKFYR